MSENNDDIILFFEAPKIEPPEFRLYYDENTGDILFYTCEKPEGKFIVIDSVTFACARYDVKVVGSKLVSSYPSVKISTSKLIPDIAGILCINEDISILANESVNDTQYWNLKTYDL